jgi:hypothetical protein
MPSQKLPIPREVIFFLAVVLPLSAVLQPLMPAPTDSFALYFRTLLLPALLLIFIKRTFDPLATTAFATYFLALYFVHTHYFGEYFFLNTAALFGSIFLFRAGYQIAARKDSTTIWSGLVVGSGAINAITIAVLFLATVGIIDKTSLITSLGKQQMFGLDRFSLGNPIEIPLLVNALFIAGIKNERMKNSTYFLAILNMATSLISGSRIVFLISVFAFLECVMRGSYSKKWAVAILAVAVLALNIEFVLPYYSAIADRYSGADDGSLSDRTSILSLVLGQIQPLTLLFGGGMNNSYYFMYEAMGQFRSVESIALELILDFGIIGTALLAFCFTANLGVVWSRAVRSIADAPILLLFVQVFLFLPLNNLTPLVFGCIGAAMGAKAVDVRVLPKRAEPKRVAPKRVMQRRR